MHVVFVALWMLQTKQHKNTQKKENEKSNFPKRSAKKKPKLLSGLAQGALAWIVLMVAANHENPIFSIGLGWYVPLAFNSARGLYSCSQTVKPLLGSRPHKVSGTLSWGIAPRQALTSQPLFKS